MQYHFMNVNPCKLHGELIAAEVIIQSSFDNSVGEVWFTAPDEQESVINAVVAAHDNTPTEPPKSEVELLQEENAFLRASVDELNGSILGIVELIFIAIPELNQ